MEVRAQCSAADWAQDRRHSALDSTAGRQTNPNVPKTLSDEPRKGGPDLQQDAVIKIPAGMLNQFYKLRP